jgi:phosphocarrier protein
MVQKTFTITNKMGLHMRPANTFVTEMSKFSSDVDIVFGGKRINGKSIMNIMAGCIKCGSEITVECSGKEILKKRYAFMRPPEMENLTIDFSACELNENSRVELRLERLGKGDGVK